MIIDKIKQKIVAQELDHSIVFDKIGGSDVFHELVENFYSLVKEDDLLIPMYPKTLDMAKKKLALFLIKKFGGPDEYTPLRGHPKMRRRHMKFPIGIKERNRWVKHMKTAMDQTGLDESPDVYLTLTKYFEWMASHMMNKSDIGIVS